MDRLWRIVETDGAVAQRWRQVATVLVAFSGLMALLLGVIPAWYAPSSAVMFLACAPAMIGLSLWFVDYATREDESSVAWRDHVAELLVAPVLLALFVAIMAVLLIAILTHFVFYGLL
jgi:hypothetical protein